MTRQRFRVTETSFQSGYDCLLIESGARFSGTTKRVITKRPLIRGIRPTTPVRSSVWDRARWLAVTAFEAARSYFDAFKGDSSGVLQ